MPRSRTPAVRSFRWKRET